MNDITLLSAASLSGATATISAASPGKPGSKSPHCKVCGDESSGFHYGVDSCEGCKGFFRRCITQGMTHKCANEEKCEITPFTRNSCQFCRLRKCFEVGMSREASRLGRRPKRLKDVSGEQNKTHGNLPIAPYPTPAEMYRLRMSELQKMLQANGTFKAELMDAFLSAAKESFRDHAKHPSSNSSSETQQSSAQQPTYSQASVVTSSGMQPQQLNNIVPKVESGYSSLSSPASSKSQSPSQDLNSAASMSNNGMQMLDMFNVPGLDDITPTTSPNNSNLPDNVASPLGDQLLDFNEFLMEQITIKSEPDLSPCGGAVTSDVIPNQIPIKEEYFSVLQEVQKPPSEAMQQLILSETPNVVSAHMTTTINHKSNVAEANERINYNLQHKPGFYDECNNPQVVWSKFLSAMAPEIENVVKFCKKIPGFKELDQEDQIKLLKRGSFDVLLARFTLLVNPQTQEMMDPTLSLRCPRHVVENMPMGMIIKEFYGISEVLKPLDLTDGEIAIFSAILIISPDRVSPKNRMTVTKVKGLLHHMFYELLKTNHPDPDNLFLETLSTIPLFQIINERHADTLNNIKMTSPSAFEAEFPPLHKEIFDR